MSPLGRPRRATSRKRAQSLLLFSSKISRGGPLEQTDTGPDAPWPFRLRQNRHQPQEERQTPEARRRLEHRLHISRRPPILLEERRTLRRGEPVRRARLAHHGAHAL